MEVKQTIYKMLTENTGKALMDSGDAYGRHWEANQNRTLKDFEADPEVECDSLEDGYTISVFHYLNGQLDLDEFCEKFNKLNANAEDWDSDIYGVSAKSEKWLSKRGFNIGESFNSYNGEDFLSQVIQGTYCTLGDRHYVLLQIHQGCDVRGGYTDARMFYLPEFDNYYGLMPQDVYGSVELKNGKNVPISNTYDGCNLTVEDGDDEPASVVIGAGEIKKISLSIAGL